MNRGGDLTLGRPVRRRENQCRLRNSWVSGWPAGLTTLVVGMLLSGCAGRLIDDPEPQVVRVEVPVQVPCRTERVQRPAFAVDALPLGATIDEQMRALRAERRQRQGYEARLEAANEVCQ